jgi:hypothetical protein
MIRLFFIIFMIVFASCGDSHIVNNDPSRLVQTAESECPFHFQSEDLCLEMSWEVMPTDTTFGSMVLTFTDKKNRDLQITPKRDPFVVLWMTSMGHGSSPVTVEPIEAGKFRINDVFFIMPGPWDIKYQLKDEDEVVEELTQAITV